MPQKDTWEKEYRNPQLLTKSPEPRTDFKKYLKFLRKIEKVNLENLTILDLGSGMGRHGNYLAQLNNTVFGLDISSTAVETARLRAEEMGVKIDYRVADIGAKYPFDNEYFDLVIDVMSSTSLDNAERAIYLSEVHRVLKSGGHFFVRGLCKDGDKNANNLLKSHPGKERDTYINEDMGLAERVFSQDEFTKLYSAKFKIQKLTKKTNYARFKGQNYKRNYWLAYLKKV